MDSNRSPLLLRHLRHIAVHDSKNPEAGILTLSPEAYVAFVGHVGAGR